MRDEGSKDSDWDSKTWKHFEALARDRPEAGIHFQSMASLQWYLYREAHLDQDLCYNTERRTMIAQMQTGLQHCSQPIHGGRISILTFDPLVRNRVASC